MRKQNTNDTNGRMDTNDEKIEYKELSYRVIECAIEIHNVLGPGYSEKIYEEAFVRELKDGGIPYGRQKPTEVIYKGEKIGDIRLDLVVENKAWFNSGAKWGTRTWSTPCKGRRQ